MFWDVVIAVCRKGMSTQSNRKSVELKKRETAFFDNAVQRRSRYGNIPESADIRRANRVVPKRGDEEPVDPRMSEILYGDYRKKYLDFVAHEKGGRVLELCCGPGWLALELGRMGQIVDAYDISPESISLAKHMLMENSCTEDSCQVNYHLEDVMDVEWGREKYDAISCWASWYYLSDFETLKERVWIALKAGGIFAIEDDRSQRHYQQLMERITMFILPTYGRSYLDKTRSLLRRIKGRNITEHVHEITCPATKMRDDLPNNICGVLKGQFKVLMDVHFNSFSLAVMRRLKGPPFFRYTIAHLLAMFDRFLCRTNIFQGRNRIIVVQKRSDVV